MQEQPRAPPSLAAIAPDFSVSVGVVLEVPTQGVARVGEVGADLVSATGDRGDLQQREMVHLV